MQHDFRSAERSIALSQTKDVCASRFIRALTGQPTPPPDPDCDWFTQGQSRSADDLFGPSERRKGCQSLPSVSRRKPLKTNGRRPKRVSRISTSFRASNFKSRALAAPAKRPRGLGRNDVRFGFFGFAPPRKGSPVAGKASLGDKEPSR
jgi:hypothetical protein